MNNDTLKIRSCFNLVELMIFLAIIAILYELTLPKAFAQNAPFQTTRTAILSSGTLSGTTTNEPVDTHGWSAGMAKIDFLCATNAGDAVGTLTVTVQTSADKTNWTGLANYALSSSTSVIYTNLAYGGTSLKATNTFLLPGTFTTPTAATSGFATSYLAPAPFTNSSAVTVTGGGNYQIGFNIGSNNRYFRTIWTAGSGTTNYVGFAVLTASKRVEVK